MKKMIAILSLSFTLSCAPAFAVDGDDIGDDSAGGALVEKKAEKVAPAKKAKKEKKAAKGKKATDAPAADEAPKVTDALKPVEKKKEKEAAAAEDKKAGKRSDGLIIEDVKKGTGMEAQLGKTITVHYKGTLMNGKVFDSSYERNEPIAFPLEEGRLIKGWTEGIPGMKVGGKRKLTIPYAMAYGERGTPDGSIPPRSDLKFEVELIKVE